MIFLEAAAEFLGAPNLRVSDLEIAPDHMTLTAGSGIAVVPCPNCQQRNSRVHSTYLRQVSDLPWGPRTVTLRLRVRRFFCDAARCSRKIFAERFGELVAP